MISLIHILVAIALIMQVRHFCPSAFICCSFFADCRVLPSLCPFSAAISRTLSWIHRRSGCFGAHSCGRCKSSGPRSSCSKFDLRAARRARCRRSKYTSGSVGGAAGGIFSRGARRAQCSERRRQEGSTRSARSYPFTRTARRAQCSTRRRREGSPCSTRRGATDNSFPATR